MQSIYQQTSIKARQWDKKPLQAPMAKLRLCIVKGKGAATTSRFKVLNELAVLMGATLTASCSCDVCVMCQQTSATCKPAKRGANSSSFVPNDLGIQVHIVTDEWLLSCAEHGEQLPVDEYKYIS